MTILTITAVQSNSVAGLLVDVAAAIAAGKQPHGDMFKDPATGQMTQLMSTGTGNASFAAYAVNGALDPDGGVAYLSKGSAGAYTLAAPAADHVELEIIAVTAFGHVVTATDLIDDGVTGGPKDTLTFAAFDGAAIRLRGYGGRWKVIAKNLVTVAAV